MCKRHVPPLEAPRIRLRLLEEQDLPRTLAWRNQDQVRRWFFTSQPLTFQEHADWFARYRQRDDDFVFIIEDKQSSRHTPCAVRQKPPASDQELRLAPQGGRHTECACYFACPTPETGGEPRPIGQAALYNIDWHNGTAEFGRLMIGEAHAAGRGLAREATDALLALAFQQFGLQEVYLEVMPGNQRAIGVYQACGFEVTASTETALRMSKRAGGMPSRASG